MMIVILRALVTMIFLVGTFSPNTSTASAWAKTCPVLDKVENGRHRCTNDKFTPGTTCTLVCEDGFEHNEPCIGDNECVDDDMGDPMWDMITPLCIPITSPTTAASVIAATIAATVAPTTSSTPTLCYSTPFATNKTSYVEAKSRCENYTDGHLWTPTNSHQQQLPLYGFVTGGIWTSASKSSNTRFEWRNKVEVEAYPYSVVADITAEKTLPTSFVRGSKTIVGSLIWNGGQPNMGNDALVAAPNHNYGVLLHTAQYVAHLKVICEHKCV